ncbi:MAG: Type 1 glutamine amidotransferase-like domain-containing protein [Actinomycetota bacterium]
MTGPIALVGGGEFLPAARPVDEWLLRRAASQSVAVLPTAAAHQRPEMAIATARRHFRGLGAEVDELAVLEREDAGDESLARRAREADFIYLCGGDPRHLLEVLRDSAVWQSILDARRRGAVLAGSSAGAMVLCEFLRPPGSSAPVRALGLVERVVVVPHHDRTAAAGMRASASMAREGARVLGIDESTALVLDGGRCHVIGAGGVTLYAASAPAWTRTAPAEMEGCL